MDATTIAHPTRTIFVDERLCEEISELTGIEYRMLSTAVCTDIDPHSIIGA